MYATPLWISIPSALLAPIAAFMAIQVSKRQAVIAEAQFRVNKNKLRLDLFEKRYSVFMAGRDYYASLVASTSVYGVDARTVFLAKSLEARFLFTEEIGNLMLEFHNGPGIRLESMRSQAKSPPSHLSPHVCSEAVMKASEEVESAWNHLAAEMKPFLKLSSD